MGNWAFGRYVNDTDFKSRASGMPSFPRILQICGREKQEKLE